MCVCVCVCVCVCFKNTRGLGCLEEGSVAVEKWVFLKAKIWGLKLKAFKFKFLTATTIKIIFSKLPTPIPPKKKTNWIGNKNEIRFMKSTSSNRKLQHFLLRGCWWWLCSDSLRGCDSAVSRLSTNSLSFCSAIGLAHIILYLIYFIIYSYLI